MAESTIPVSKLQARDVEQTIKFYSYQLTASASIQVGSSGTMNAVVFVNAANTGSQDIFIISINSNSSSGYVTKVTSGSGSSITFSNGKFTIKNENSGTMIHVALMVTYGTLIKY